MLEYILSTCMHFLFILSGPQSKLIMKHFCLLSCFSLLVHLDIVLLLQTIIITVHNELNLQIGSWLSSPSGYTTSEGCCHSPVGLAHGLDSFSSWWGCGGSKLWKPHFQAKLLFWLFGAEVQNNAPCNECLSNRKRQKSIKVFWVLYVLWADVSLETSESQLPVNQKANQGLNPKSSLQKQWRCKSVDVLNE